MILKLTALVLALTLCPAIAEPFNNSIQTCLFKAGRIVIEQPDDSGKVMVQVDGQARPYVMDKLKLVPREASLPAFSFQPESKRWHWLNDQGEPIESTMCIEKPAIRTG